MITILGLVIASYTLISYGIFYANYFTAGIYDFSKGTIVQV